MKYFALNCRQAFPKLKIQFALNFLMKIILMQKCHSNIQTKKHFQKTIFHVTALPCILVIRHYHICSFLCLHSGLSSIESNKYCVFSLTRLCFCLAKLSSVYTPVWDPNSILIPPGFDLPNGTF